MRRRPLTVPSVSLRGLVIDNEGNSLLVRRSASCRTGAGLYECPGGKPDRGLHLAEEREFEIEQETGFRVSESFPWVYEHSRRGTDNGRIYATYFKLLRVTGGELALSKEHDDALWLPYGSEPEVPITIESKLAVEIFRPIIPAVLAELP